MHLKYFEEIYKSILKWVTFPGTKFFDFLVVSKVVSETAMAQQLGVSIRPYSTSIEIGETRRETLGDSGYTTSMRQLRSTA